MLAGMVNISYHHNSLSCLVPPITTSLSGLISYSQFLLLSLTNENPPRVGSECRLTLIAAAWSQSVSQSTSSRNRMTDLERIGETINLYTLSGWISYHSPAV